jgi:lactoylglutathione lyase/methylmalonyl-CoA/ethylmalonyl-CoA epimerase
MIKQIHHIGIVVKNLDEAVAMYEAGLGLAASKVTESEKDGVRIAFMPAGETLVELLEPTNPAGGVARFLETRGEGIHHIAIEVDDIAAHLIHLEAAGAVMIDKAPRQGAEGMVAFIHPKSMKGVLVELVQRT